MTPGSISTGISGSPATSKINAPPSVRSIRRRRGEIVQDRRSQRVCGPIHRITRDEKGMIWFNINPGRGGLGRVDPKTEKIDVFLPPTGMSPTGGATTVDFDGKGRIWSSSPDGALNFDPTTEKFTEFKSIPTRPPTVPA